MAIELSLGKHAGTKTVIPCIVSWVYSMSFSGLPKLTEGQSVMSKQHPLTVCGISMNKDCFFPSMYVSASSVMLITLFPSTHYRCPDFCERTCFGASRQSILIVPLNSLSGIFFNDQPIGIMIRLIVFLLILHHAKRSSFLPKKQGGQSALSLFHYFSKLI